MVVMFKPEDRLDRLFQLGIIAKGLNGLLELGATRCTGFPCIPVWASLHSQCSTR
jgi:hypothetical protein